MLGPVRLATNEDQHLHSGDVAVAGNHDDSTGFAGVGGCGLARGEGSDPVSGHVGGGWRRFNGQSVDGLGQRGIVTVARDKVPCPSDL